MVPWKHNPGLTWHWIATQRAQPAWAASLVTAVTRQQGGGEEDSVIQTRQDTGDCVCVFTWSWHGQWSRSRLNMVPPCFGSQACLSVSPLQALIGGRQTPASWIWPAIAIPCGILSRVPSTPDCISEPGHESQWSHSLGLASTRVEGEGGSKPRSEFGSSLALESGNPRFAGVWIKNKTPHYNNYISVCSMHGVLMIDWDFEKEKSWHLTHLFKQNQDSSSAHTQITRSSLAQAHKIHKQTLHFFESNIQFLHTHCVWCIYRILEPKKSSSRMATNVSFHSNLISPHLCKYVLWSDRLLIRQTEEWR